MSPRSIRRAMERKAQKQARKQANAVSAAAVAAAEPITADQEELPLNAGNDSHQTTIRKPTTLPQLQANRRNAQFSTGPHTVEGKAVASRNALKTGLTGKTVLLPNEDAALYQDHVDSFRCELNPVGDRESALVQSIADAKWRLARIPTLEFGIYALGRIEFAEQFSHLPAAEAAVLIEAKTFLAYQRQLNNLSIQESRLRRQSEKDSVELRRLQQLRAESERLSAKVRQDSGSVAAALPRTEIGFEFETSAHTSFEPQIQRDFSPQTIHQAA